MRRRKERFGSLAKDPGLVIGLRCVGARARGKDQPISKSASLSRLQEEHAHAAWEEPRATARQPQRLHT